MNNSKHDSVRTARKYEKAVRAGRITPHVETRTPEQIRAAREAHEAKLRANGWKGDAKIVGR